MRPVETVLGMGRVGQRRMMEGLNITSICIRTFVNVRMYPKYYNNKKNRAKNILLFSYVYIDGYKSEKINIFFQNHTSTVNICTEKS
jgi:hypothetical protein